MERLKGITGWIGGLLLAGCAIPEVYESFQTGDCKLTWPFLIMWGLGEVFVLIPLILDNNKKYLIFNYGLNILCIGILIGFKL